MPLSGKFLLGRIVFSFATFLVVTLLSYIIAYSASSSFVPVQGLIVYFHLNQPIFQGYFSWVWALLHGDLGVSLYGGQVVDWVAPWILPTVILEIPAIVVSVFLGLVLGVYSASKQNSFADRAISTASNLFYGVPAYWLALVGIVVFSFHLRLLPAFGYATPYPPYWWGSQAADLVAHYILPFSILVLVSAPLYVRVARLSALETLSKDWVSAMKVAAVGNRRILYTHVLRNSLGPVLSLMVYNVAIFLAASPGIEIAFSWPGLGLGFAHAALHYDYPLMLGIIVIMSLVTVVANFTIDLFQGAIDPRVGST